MNLITSYYDIAIDNCADGSIHLTGGSEGAVEICLDDAWGTVSFFFFAFWNTLNSEVVCRQLGFPWNCK